MLPEALKLMLPLATPVTLVSVSGWPSGSESFARTLYVNVTAPQPGSTVCISGFATGGFADKITTGKD